MDFEPECGRDRAKLLSVGVAARVANVCQLDSVDGSRSLADQSLGRDRRLRRRIDFLRCYRQGRKKHGSLVSLHFHPNSLNGSRLGITASRKIGNSVVRHRVKRRVREVFRRYDRRSELEAWDVVVHLKPPSSQANFKDLENELEKLLGRLLPAPSVRR